MLMRRRKGRVNMLSIEGDRLIAFLGIDGHDGVCEIPRYCANLLSPNLEILRCVIYLAELFI